MQVGDKKDNRKRVLHKLMNIYIRKTSLQNAAINFLYLLGNWGLIEGEGYYRSQGCPLIQL